MDIGQVMRLGKEGVCVLLHFRNEGDSKRLRRLDR